MQAARYRNTAVNALDPLDDGLTRLWRSMLSARVFVAVVLFLLTLFMTFTGAATVRWVLELSVA